jgi:hypothetical protein
VLAEFGRLNRRALARRPGTDNDKVVLFHNALIEPEVYHP